MASSSSINVGMFRGLAILFALNWWSEFKRHCRPLCQLGLHRICRSMDAQRGAGFVDQPFLKCFQPPLNLWVWYSTAQISFHNQLVGLCTRLQNRTSPPPNPTTRNVLAPFSIPVQNKFNYFLDTLFILKLTTVFVSCWQILTCSVRKWHCFYTLVHSIYTLNNQLVGTPHKIRYIFPYSMVKVVSRTIITCFNMTFKKHT